MKHSAATAPGVKARANASAAGSKKGAKVRPAILTEDQRYEFMFVAPALPITGAVGSPINPLAIK